MTAKSLYTHTLPKDMAMTVRAIPAPEDCLKIQSCPTTYDKDKGGNWVQWASAWQHPQTGLWTLETHQRFTADDAEGTKPTRQKKTVAQNVSFFDALHYCAFEEVSRKAAGATLLTLDNGKTLHYSDAASLAHQPLDMQGIPHPAAYGEVLTDGMFDDAAYVTAEATQGQVLNIDHGGRANASQLIDLSSVGQVQQGQSAVSLDKMQRKEGLIHDFKQALNFAGNRRNKVSNRRENDWFLRNLKDDISPKINFNEPPDYRGMVQFLGYILTGVTVLGLGVTHFITGTVTGTTLLLSTGGALGITTAIKTIPTLATGVLDAAKNVKDSLTFGHSLRKLPDCALKNDIKTYHRTIKAVNHFARAADIIEEHGYSSRRHLKRAFNQVGKGAKLANMSAVEVEQLRMMIAEKKFPAAQSFLNKLNDMERDLGKAFEAVKGQIETADDVPALEDKQEMPIDLQMTQRNKVPEPR